MTTPRQVPGPGHGLLLVAVSRRPGFLGAVGSALAGLTDQSDRAMHTDGGLVSPDDASPPAYAKALWRARRYLDRALPRADIHLVTAGSLAQAGAPAAAEAERYDGRLALALVLVDAVSADLAAAPFASEIDEGLEKLCSQLPPTVQTEISPYTTLVYAPPCHDGVQVARRYALRQPSSEPWVLAADVVCAFTDFVQLRYSSLAGHLTSGTRTRTLAAALYAFLSERAGSRWGLHYYTGSIVSGLIDDLERMARASGNPVLRGPSEHSLACGALARWQLDQAPFLIVVTSGMIDEFRGALANLRTARAQGFIVSGDSPVDRWFPFQGTVHAAEDSREVLRARRLPAFYLDRPEQLAEELEGAFGAFDRGEGPVVLLATPTALDATVEVRPPRPSTAPGAPSTTVTTRARDDGLDDGRVDHLDTILDLVNLEEATLLWQCGQLTADESGLVHDIARRAGIGLVDSLARPGSVARYRHGQVVEEYLGSLGLYGYSARVYDYLHRGGRLKPRDEQCLFFLKSRIPEVATPFSERMLSRSLRIVQVTDDPHDRAPFADYAVVADLASFLRCVRDRLDVRPEVLDMRRAAIAAAQESASDVVGELPLQPMSLNYFFRRLGTVLEQLITTEGYTYTGVFDVGRGGLSAVRNLPRTGPGFSGWYGRALMGDALQAAPTIALTRPDNVLAFVGDGAAGLVPDILPMLVQQVCVGGARLHGNLSIFRLIDGGHSLIRTYREARHGAAAGYQATLVGLVDEDWHRSFGPLEVAHRRLTDVDQPALTEQLHAAGTVNLYSVILTHNNEGDGLSLLASLGWQRDHLPELAFGTTGAATTHQRESR